MSKLGALTVTKNTGAKHTATVIFFHGSGSNGRDMREWVHATVKNFTFPHIKVIYPTAPLQPYSPASGFLTNVWFDRAGISQEVSEELDSINKIEVEVRNLINNEKNLGIPSNRIIVGGFSMGGALSFYAGYKWEQNLAGVFAFSSFLNNNSIVYQDLMRFNRTELPPLLQIHGNCDDLVKISWGQKTFNELKALGVNGEFHIMEGLQHYINRRGMNIIKQWIEKLLPDV